MTEQPAPRARPSISERAAKRQALQRSERDRYANLTRALQAGREVPLRPRSGERLQWHPIAWLLLRIALIAAVVYVIAVFGHRIWRDQQVDNWSGPDTTVTSGQRLAGCAPANSQHDEYLPTWVRYDGRVYVITERQRPLVNAGMPNETGQIETGYSLERIRILIPSELPPGEPPSRILLVITGSYSSTIFEHAPDCA